MARKVRTTLGNMMIDTECREEEQITTAPGLKLERQERRAGVNCTAAGETWECTSTLL